MTSGLDYLALHTHSSRKAVYSVGSRIGVGKESDIMIVADEKGTQRVLKIHRLGRISFRTVKSNRDYLRNKQSGSWMYLSRLAAMKEYAFMQALREEGFPVPEPLGQSRHTIVMSLIDAFPLRQIAEVPDPASLYSELINLLLRLAQHGLIHGDYNEFNILIKEIPTTNDAGEESLRLEPVIIDFPQMVSMEHQNAEMYFDRDVECIKRFFQRRFHFTSTQPGPFFKNAYKAMRKGDAKRLDATVEASGFTKKMIKDLEAAVRQKAETREDQGENDDDESGEDDSEEDESADDEGPIVIGGQDEEGEEAHDEHGGEEEVHEGMSKLAV